MAAINGTNVLVSVWTGATSGSSTLIACSTTCTLTINQTTIPSTCKSVADWTTFILGRKNWEITVDGLAQFSNKVSMEGLLGYLVGSTTNSFEIEFDIDSNITVRGTASITSLTSTGGDDETATYSVSFIGNGSLDIA